MKRVLVWLALAVAPFQLYGADPAENDFPTQARVEFVLNCMGERGGQTYDTLYPCVCIIDTIASGMPYREYTAAETLTFLYSTPGERGGMFRDAAPRSRARIKALKALREEAEAACLVSSIASSEAH